MAPGLRSLWALGNATMVSNVNAIRVNANLRGRHAIIVQGRADALVPINHASRPYLGANRVAEGSKSQLSLYEVMYGQHFDAFLRAWPDSIRASFRSITTTL